MANKNVQLKDLNGNLLFPKTLGSNVFNNAQKNLGGVEENAQVNVLEGVQFNGADLAIADKKVNLQLTLTKEATATEGYFATYKLYNGATAVGDAINIPKDYLVKSASMKTCTVPGVPETTPALKIGEPYFDFVVNTVDSTGTDSHLYINVASLVDTYTEGDGINIVDNVISVDTTDTAIQGAIEANSTKFVQAGVIKTALDGKVDKLAVKPTAGAYTKVTINEEGQVTAATTLAASDIPDLATAKVTTLGGYVKGADKSALAASDTLNAALAKLENKADEKVVANNAITGATKCKITYDSKGLVTAGADLTLNDLPALTSEKVTLMTGYEAIASGEVADVAETDTLNQAVAKLQYAVSKTQDKITGAASTIVTDNLAANKFVISNANGKIAASTVASDANLLVWEEI